MSQTGNYILIGNTWGQSHVDDRRFTYLSAARGARTQYYRGVGSIYEVVLNAIGDPELKLVDKTEPEQIVVQGLTEAEARKRAIDAGYAFRVTNRDGHAQIVTMDYRLDRISVHVDDGIVTKASLG